MSALADKINNQGTGPLIYRLGIIACCFFVALCVAAGMADWISTYFEPDSRSYYLSQSAVQSIVGFIGAAMAAGWIISRKPGSFLGMTEKVSIKPFIGVIIVYLIGIPFLNQLIYWNSIIELPEKFAPIESVMRQMEDSAAIITERILSVTDVGGLVSGLLIIGILTGFSEELFFRGALQRSLTAYKPFGQWSIWIAAFIFSAVHLQFYGFFPRLLLGAFFGYILYSTGSIWPGAFAHILNNSLVVVTSWIEKRGGQEMSSPEEWFVSTDSFPVLPTISFVALILFFCFCYGYFFTGKTSADNKSLKS